MINVGAEVHRNGKHLMCSTCWASRGTEALHEPQRFRWPELPQCCYCQQPAPDGVLISGRGALALEVRCG